MQNIDMTLLVITGPIKSDTSRHMVFHHFTLASASIEISWKESKGVCPVLRTNSKSPQSARLTLKYLILQGILSRKIL